jgi:site-specific DNA recombinase
MEKNWTEKDQLDELSKLEMVKNIEQEFNVSVIRSHDDLRKFKIFKTTSNSAVGYTRYSSRMQDEGFSLPAQVRQILERAKQDGYQISAIFMDIGLSAYELRKKRPGYDAMLEMAKSNYFKRLYVHKIDRLDRRLVRLFEVLSLLEDHSIMLVAVEQSFDFATISGKLMLNLLAALGEYYSANLSQETVKGKYESSRQGYHNGSVPWGYKSVEADGRKIGVPDPELVPVVKELFEKYATGIYSYLQLAEWLEDQEYKTLRGESFSDSTIREIIQNPYYIGKVRYKGAKERKKGQSYRSADHIESLGKQEAIIDEETWYKCQRSRQIRSTYVKNRVQTSHVYLINGIVYCASCGNKLRAQTPKGTPSYYRDASRNRGKKCPSNRKSVPIEVIDEQIAEFIKSLRLVDDWQDRVRVMMEIEKPKGPDPESEKKRIRGMLKRMRDAYIAGKYGEDEITYFNESRELEQKLAILEQSSYKKISLDSANQLMGLRDCWEFATQGERRDLVQMMLQEVYCDLDLIKVVKIKPKPDYELLFKVALSGKWTDDGYYLL